MNIRKLRVHAHGFSNRNSIQVDKKTAFSNRLFNTTHSLLKKSFLELTNQNSFIHSSLNKNTSSIYKTEYNPYNDKSQNKLKMQKKQISILASDNTNKQKNKEQNTKQSYKDNNRIKSLNLILKNQNKLRNVFKNKKNVHRIMKAWNFLEKGYLSSSQLYQIMNNRLNLEIPQTQISNLVQKYSKRNDNKITTDQFVNILYAPSQHTSFKPEIYENSKLQASNQKSLQKLKNSFTIPSKCIQENKQKDQIIERQLGQDMSSLVKSYHICSSKIRTQYPTLKNTERLKISDLIKKSKRFKTSQPMAFDQITNRVGLQQNINSIYNYQDLSSTIYDSFIQKQKLLKNKKNQSAHLNQFTKKDFNLSNLSFTMSSSNFMKSKSKFNLVMRQSLTNPKLMLGVDQRKTRFNGNPIEHIDKSQRQYDKDDYRNSKEKIDQQLNNQIAKRKRRYENKLNIIKNNRQNQKKSITKLDNKAQLVDNANINKRKIERQAYNYINFLHNQWR